MATIKGVWTFKDIVDPFTGPAETITQAVNFKTADGVARTEIKIRNDTDNAPILLDLDGWTVAIYDGGRFRWVETDEAYKTVDFGNTEQTVSDEFYSLFKQIATKEYPLSEKLVVIAENQQRVYDAGYEKGVSESYDTGYAGGYAEGSALFKGVVEGTVEEINDDTITKARAYAFACCKSLKTATLNNLKSADSSFFNSCTALETVVLPALTGMAYTGFSGCTSLKNVHIPNAGTHYGCFYNCSALEFLDFPKCSYINDASFQGCAKLKALVLRYSGVATLNNLRAFSGTPFRNGEGGTVYVPQSQIEKYKTATNWNALESTTFLPIEGSEYE